MTDYSELVKALRSKFFAYDVTGNHNSAQLYKDAAAAIEELENALADECKECDYLVNENARLTTENKELQAEVERLQVDIEAAYALMEVQDDKA